MLSFLVPADYCGVCGERDGSRAVVGDCGGDGVHLFPDCPLTVGGVYHAATFKTVQDVVVGVTLKAANKKVVKLKSRKCIKHFYG
jgi:hypothetical protein